MMFANALRAWPWAMQNKPHKASMRVWRLRKPVAAMTCHMRVGMCFDVQVYRHIVLAVCDASSGLYGAVGISRCRQLMDKPLKHPSLAALVGEYQQAYRCEFSRYV